MPQTLLALLALALASLLTFNQQRLTVRSQRGMVASEIELAATGLASEVMEMIGGRSFDEESTPEKIAARGGAVPTLSSSFSSPGAFGIAGECDLMEPARTPACDDIDDVASDEWSTVAVQLAHGRSLDFDIRTDVYYVESTSSMEPADEPTRHKRVVMDVRSDYAPGRDRDGVLHVTRVFSYDPVKAEMDYENSDAYISGETSPTTTSETPGS